MKMELEQETGEKQFQEVVCHTPVQNEMVEAGKTRAGQEQLFSEQEVTFDCLLVTASCSTCFPVHM
jgi:hypothetical protein